MELTIVQVRSVKEREKEPTEYKSNSPLIEQKWKFYIGLRLVMSYISLFLDVQKELEDKERGGGGVGSFGHKT